MDCVLTPKQHCTVNKKAEEQKEGKENDREYAQPFLQPTSQSKNMQNICLQNISKFLLPFIIKVTNEGRA